jgi:hypothetical protein
LAETEDEKGDPGFFQTSGKCQRAPLPSSDQYIVMWHLLRPQLCHCFHNAQVNAASFLSKATASPPESIACQQSDVQVPIQLDCHRLLQLKNLLLCRRSTAKGRALGGPDHEPCQLLIATSTVSCPLHWVRFESPYLLPGYLNPTVDRDSRCGL